MSKVRRPKVFAPQMEFEPTTGPRKNLLVGSVFAGDDPLQRQWLDLQLQFFKETTDFFDHAVVLYGGPSDYFSERTEVITPDRNPLDNRGHIYGLQILKKLFQSRRNQYEGFLFIDSDAFPIKKGWQAHLIDQMNETVVAPVLRTENLETRLHASVLYVKPEALDKVGFHMFLGTDLVGNEERDVGIEHFETHRKEVFTLVRSNQYNIHPVMCGVYYDMFYHHGLGSITRGYDLRSQHYWGFLGDPDLKELLDSLMVAPREFVDKLAGWRSNRE